MISLFEGKRRTRSGPANDVEDTYSYLDVSARGDMSITRELLNEWFLIPRKPSLRKTSD
jgi:hypothetical protein